MNCIKQSASNFISIETELELSKLTGLATGIFQDGQQVLFRRSDELSLEGNVICFQLESWETEKLRPGRFALELRAVNDQGVFISESIEGFVESSRMRQAGGT